MPVIPSPKRPALPFTLALALLVAGCSDDSGGYYEIEDPEAAARETAPSDPPLPEGHPPLTPPPATADMSNATLPESMVARDALPQWTLPEGWTEGPERPMRRASFVLGDSGLELAVTSFPGDVGGLEANVNRWRRQLGMGPLAASEVADVVTQREVAGRPFQIVDLPGPPDPAGGPPARMLTAITEVDGNSWFFKVTGPDPAVEALRPDFEAFVDSIRF